MGAGSSSLGDIGSIFSDIGDIPDFGFEFCDNWTKTRTLKPINPEGVSLKVSDANTITVYDLNVSKSNSGSVVLEEYLVETEKDTYVKVRDFVIVKDELKRTLRSLDILDIEMRFEAKPRLSSSYCLQKFSIFEFKAKKHALLYEFVSFIKESCPIFAKMDETIAAGIVPLEAVGYYLKIGTKVALSDKSICQGAYIQNVLGSTVNCTTLSQDRHGKFIEYKISVKLTEPSYTLEKLHEFIRPISETDEIYHMLTERGAAIVGSKGKIQYMNYSGPVFGSPGVITNYEHNIRVMVDLLNDIPNSYNETLAKIGSRDKEYDSVPKNRLFSVLGSIPVYHIEKSKYISVVFENLLPIQFNEQYYDELVLDPKYKEFLSLVTSNIKPLSTQIDSIKGKGQGLLFLLSGPPGVGKTMSVEMLAEKNHVPLMVISFGSLGTTPDIVEKSLQDTMRLAEYWNAILLFDEADVFLEQRSNSSDIVRNAIVGVFLQLLEYHKGVIFLTTNRETSLDRAILSRAILNINYDPLTLEQSLTIWKNMLARVTHNVDDIISMLKHDRVLIYNGRDIRNIIHIALILAQPGDITVEHIRSALDLHLG